jgi:hypothetical protein
MNPERWKREDELLQAALQLPAEQLNLARFKREGAILGHSHPPSLPN